MEGVWPSAPPSDKTHNIKDIKAIIDLKESLMSLISLRPERLRVQVGGIPKSMKTLKSCLGLSNSPV